MEAGNAGYFEGVGVDFFGAGAGGAFFGVGFFGAGFESNCVLISLK